MGKTIIAKRCVYETVQKLEKEAAVTGRKPYHLAQDKIRECRSAGDKLGIQFWRDVWMHTLLIEQGLRDVQVIEED